MKSIKVLFGSSLSTMIDGTGEHNFNDWEDNIYNLIKHETGADIPRIELEVSENPSANEYQIFINDSHYSSFELDPNEYYYIIPKDKHHEYESKYCFLEPAFGLGSVTSNSISKKECEGFNKVSSYQILSTHLCKCLKECV